MVSFTTRAATVEDASQIERLLPRLADFEIPPRLTAEDVWRYDAVVVAEWAAGNRPNTWARVAIGSAAEGGVDQIVGAAVATLAYDSFTAQPAVHLEIVVIDERADGHGLGRQLMAEIEADGKQRGATVMSLNVMVTNARARSVYQRLGFHEEMIRASKSIL